MQRHAIGQIAFIIKFRAAYGKADQPRMLLKGNSQRFRWENTCRFILLAGAMLSPCFLSSSIVFHFLWFVI